ncbi:hypothetical protein B0H19DRAFT_1028242 [Mycena capillaripes]|nr:hypothetical protein B0H19DRAFT_1028242 [Mycena capillaripes]
MMVTTIATILLIVPPLSLGKNLFTYITVIHLNMSIGISGDYPMSASVVAGRANLRCCGTMVTFIFAMQGWSALIGGIIFTVLLAIYKKGLEFRHHVGQLNSVWRIYTGILLVPAIITIVQRLIMTESTRMKGVHAVRGDPTRIMITRGRSSASSSRRRPPLKGPTQIPPLKPEQRRKPAGSQQPKPPRPLHGAMRNYFSEWRHLKIFIGTTTSWFLLDLIFHGISSTSPSSSSSWASPARRTPGSSSGSGVWQTLSSLRFRSWASS